MDLFGINYIDAATAALVLGSLSLLVSLSLALSRRRAGPRGLGSPETNASASSPSGGFPEAEIVAVIAAAVAASSGMAPGSFRIAGIQAGRATGGFSTPIWGHVDRITRTPFKA